MMPLIERFLVLVRRYPFCAVCTLVILALSGGAWYIIGENEDLEIVRQGRAKEGEAMLALLVGGSSQRQELATVREVARRIEEHLVVETNLAENAFYFYKFEEQTKARLPELHPLTSPASETSTLYRRVPYTLRVAGTYAQVSAFLFAVETGPRIANITAFGFSRRDLGSSEILLDLSLELLGKK